MGPEVFTPALLNGVGVTAVILFVGLLVLRGDLIPRKWHLESLRLANERTSKAEEARDRWEAIALRTLEATEALAEPVSVSAKVLTNLPNPAREVGGS